jgi:peptidyl-prolyl cis-trans isomerase A (cyclophilin A)
MSRLASVLLVLLLAACGDRAGDQLPVAANRMEAAKAAAPAPAPASARVRIATELGDIVVLLDGRRAPLTTANFLRYADDGRFDGKTFYRAARNRAAR